MNTRGLTLREFLTQIKSLETNICSVNKEWPVTKWENLLCLNDQFYLLIDFPFFSSSWISNNIKDFLGFIPEGKTSLDFFNRIHPNDLPIVLLATLKILNSTCYNYKNIRPYDSVFSMDYRIKTNNNQYHRFLNQNCVVCKDDNSIRFKILSLFTDISHIKSTNKIEFNQSHKGTDRPFIFPDDELKAIYAFFTTRELDIIKLLSKGKNSKEIATILNISHHTIDTHRRNMLAKAQQSNTAQLVAFAIENGYIPNTPID